MNTLRKMLGSVFQITISDYQDSYTYQVYRHIKKLYDQFCTYYNPKQQNMGYIATTIVDVQHLTDICGAARNSSIGEGLMHQFKKENAKAPNKGVLFMWSHGQYESMAISLTETIEVDALIKNSLRVLAVSDVVDSALYKAFIQLQPLNEHLTTMARWRQESDPQVDLLSVHQEVVDYILKLSAIGEDTDVFMALTDRDDNWIETFFKPLALINQQLKLLPAGSTAIDTTLGDNKLTAIVNWSTPKIKPLEDVLIEQPRPQQAYQLFDPNVYNPDQPSPTTRAERAQHEFPELSVVEPQKAIDALAEQDQTDWANILKLKN